MKKQQNELAKTILNITGSQHVLSLAINLHAQQNNPLLKPQARSQTLQNTPFLIPGILTLGILAGMSLALLPRWFKRNKKAGA